MKPARIINLLAKFLLAALLVYGALNQNLSQFHGKGMNTRVWAYMIPVVLLPLIWLCLGKARRVRWPYPDVIDICLVAPFLLDTAGNALNLYDSIDWFDDAMHTLTWIPWVVAFGLLLHYARPPLPKWAHFGVTLAFGAVTHILWEEAEYLAFIRYSKELATAYTDTLGDLAMSLLGSTIGSLLVVTVLWQAGQAIAQRRTD